MAAENDPQSLIREIAARDPQAGAEMLASKDAATALAVLRGTSPDVARRIVSEIRGRQRRKLLELASPEEAKTWAPNNAWAEGTIGRMMEPATAIFSPDVTVGAAVESIRELVRHVFVTYGFVVDAGGKLVGIVTMRDLLLSERATKLVDVMLKDVFFLTPELQLRDAMRLVLDRHFPVYPVCLADRTLVGEIRGHEMFAEQAIEISAQPGSMVGVDKEERLFTPWLRSLKFRHPWLQLNLLTAFLAAAVVGVFQSTIDRVVILAVFLPVLAGQSGNTGCQALAVALRGLTLGELAPGREKRLLAKEALLGLLNGMLVGFTAGIGMYIAATMQKNPARVQLSLSVFLAMTIACIISGVAGVLIPLTLRKLGADPATASSIFLTTATDVVSMGSFLALATVLVPK